MVQPERKLEILEVAIELAVIGEALDWADGERTDLDHYSIDRARTALSSLKAMLEGEEKEKDEMIVVDALNMKFFGFTVQRDRALEALSHLALRAKLNEAKLVEVKQNQELANLVQKCCELFPNGWDLTYNGSQVDDEESWWTASNVESVDAPRPEMALKRLIDQQLALGKEERGKD